MHTIVIRKVDSDIGSSKSSLAIGAKITYYIPYNNFKDCYKLGI